MMTTVYRVRMQDQSLPGFADGTINYYGSEQDIITLIQGLEGSQEMLAAAKEYFSGKGPGKASLFGEEEQELIKPIKTIATAAYERNNFNFKFLNIYQYKHDINIGHMDAELLYIEDTDQKLKRCIKATLSNVSFVGMNITELLPFWGLPGFIIIKDNSVMNTLYYDDKTFKSTQSMKQDINHPHKPNLRNFFLEVVGDG